jgi:hypothetical protein
VVIAVSDYPGKILDKAYGYIYLIRFDIGDRFIYKIGITTNIKSRLAIFRIEWGCPVDLIAYGCCKNVRRVEQELHSKFFDKQFSFNYELFYPKWSDEFFKFDYDDILVAIDSLRSCSSCTIVSSQFKGECTV